MKVSPRITSISETGSKIDVAITVDGVAQPFQRFHVAELLEGGDTLENAWLLARYHIRQHLKARGRDKRAIEQIKSALDLGVEVDL